MQGSMWIERGESKSKKAESQGGTRPMLCSKLRKGKVACGKSSKQQR